MTARRRASAAATLPPRLAHGGPKGQQLREILEGMIASAEPGTPLPSERELASRYGVARMTVRSELDRLTSEGMTYRVHGSGTFVAAPKVAQAMALTSFSEDMTARGLRPGSVVLGQAVVPASSVTASRLEIAPQAPVVRIERVRTADEEPMAVEDAFLPAARFGGLQDADLSAGSLFAELEAGWGVRLGAARQRVTAVILDGDEAALLGVPRGAPGFRFATVALDQSGAVVFYATSLYRGDRYEIDLRQRRDRA